MKFLAFFIFVALLVCDLSYCKITKIQMRHAESLRSQLMKNKKWAAYLASRQKLDTATSTGIVPEKDYSDVSYVAEVKIGTPPQTFRVIMDTGSANLWVPSATCSPTQVCNQKNKYVSSSSSTFLNSQRSFTIKYGTGSCSGELASDTTCIGNICVNNQTFGQADHLASFFQGQPFDGICGLGFVNISVDGVMPPVQNMINEQKGPTSNGQIGGQLTLGDIDSDHCESKVVWINLSQVGYYQFKLGGIRIDGAAAGDVRGVGTEAISDTGTSLIAGPKNDIEDLAQKLKAKWDNSSQIVTLRFSSNKPFVLLDLSYP